MASFHPRFPSHVLCRRAHSASGLTRGIVVHFNLGNQEDVIRCRRAGGPFWVAGATEKRRSQLMNLWSQERKFEGRHAKIRRKGLLPPIIPQPLPLLRRHIIRETRLQRPIEIEIRPTRQPIETILVKPSRQIRSQRETRRRRCSRRISFLVSVMHAFELAAGEDFNVRFLGIAFVEERA